MEVTTRERHRLRGMVERNDVDGLKRLHEETSPKRFKLRQQIRMALYEIEKKTSAISEEK